MDAHEHLSEEPTTYVDIMLERLLETHLADIGVKRGRKFLDRLECFADLEEEMAQRRLVRLSKSNGARPPQRLIAASKLRNLVDLGRRLLVAMAA
jgi:hypothetical protein